MEKLLFAGQFRSYSYVYSLLLAAVLLLSTVVTSHAQSFSFVSGTPFTGVYQSSVAFADVDKDGDQDVLITGLNSSLTPVARLYTNDGTGTFTLVSGTPFTGVYQSSVAFADVDKDGDQDVLITGLSSLVPLSPVARLYRNDGTGSFTLVSGTPFTGVYQSSVAFADVDKDGDQDVLITGFNSSLSPVARLYRNDGTGTFTLVSGTPFTAVYQSSVAFADVDKDGDQDVLITGYTSSLSPVARLYRNDGTGTFSLVSGTPFMAVYQGSVAFADIDDDGAPDVLITGYTSSLSPTARLYHNDGTGTFSLVSGTPFEAIYQSSVAFADADRDGVPDVLITGFNSSLSPVAKLYRNDGTGSFSVVNGTPFTGVYRGSIAFADIDKDGDQDVLITGYNSSLSPTARLYRNDTPCSLTVSITPSSSTITVGEPVSLTASGAKSYTWSTGETTAAISATPTSTTAYSVTGVTGSCSATATATVSVTAAPISLTTSVDFSTVCAGSSVALSVEATGGTKPYSYSWTAPAGATLSATSTSAVSATVTTTGLNTFTVTVTSDGGIPLSTTTVSVMVKALPILNVTANPSLTINSGESTTLTASGADTYVWDNEDETASTEISTPGEYSVTGTTAGCSSQTTVFVEQRDCETTLTASADQVCVGQTVSLTATAKVVVAGSNTPLGGPVITPTPSYTWVAPQGVTLSNPANTSVVSATVTSAGVNTFTAIVSTAEGCISTNTVSVTVNALPTPAIDGSLTLCAGSATTLTASGGTSYSWSTGETSAAITVSPTSTTAYSVTVTNESGCQSTTSVTVTVNPVPILSIVATPSTTIVQGQSTTLTASGADTYLWSTGATTAAISVSIASTYSLTGTTSLGCSATLNTASTAPFAITGVALLSCTPINPNRYVISFIPQYTGLNGQPVTFQVANETVPTTVGGPYNLQLYTDNPVILLKAVQAGTAGDATFRFNWLQACASKPTANTPPTVVNPVGSQTATAGQSFNLDLSGVFTDAETPSLLVLSASGLPLGLSLQGTMLSGIPSVSGVSTVLVTATDPGSLSASSSFLLTVNPSVGSNTPPTLANSVSSQTATVGQAFSLDLSATFTDAETPTSLVLSISPLPSGLALLGTTLSGVPSTTVGSPLTLTLVATDPGSLTASTTFVLTVVNPVSLTSTGPFAITGVTTISCTPVFNNRIEVSFQPLYSGLTGQPISFSVANELAATSLPGPYSLQLYRDNPTVVLKASQAGTPGEVSFSYNWLAACSSPPPANTPPVVASLIPNQYTTVGQAFSYVIPAGTFTDTETPASLSLAVSGLPAGLSFTSPATISGTPSVTGASPVSVTATDPGGLWVSTQFILTVNPVVAGNTPPVVANPISPQVATVGQGFALGLGNVFSDAETPNSLVVSVSGLPAGLSLQGTAITGTPSTTVGSPFSVTVTATDPGSLSVSTSFVLVVNPAVVSPPGAFTITGVHLVSCNPISPNQRSLSFSPIYSGASASPISFSVANELASTTAVGPYTLSLYTDNPVITLIAVQDGSPASYVYNWLSVCGVTPPANTAPVVVNPIVPQSATVTSSFTYVIPGNTFSDAETPASLSLSVAGLPAGLSFTSPATISGTPSVTGTSIVTVTATDPGGLAVNTQFSLIVKPVVVSPPGTFTITGVSLGSCNPLSAGQRQLIFTPIYGGASGSPISFSVVNELVATTNPGPYTLILYTDNPTITLKAVQDGNLASYVYNWLSVCGSGRVGVQESSPGLWVKVLGNPTQSEDVLIELGGAVGDVRLVVSDSRGRQVSETTLSSVADGSRVTARLGHSVGIYLLDVSTATQKQTVKIIRE